MGLPSGLPALAAPQKSQPKAKSCRSLPHKSPGTGCGEPRSPHAEAGHGEARGNAGPLQTTAPRPAGRRGISALRASKSGAATKNRRNSRGAPGGLWAGSWPLSGGCAHPILSLSVASRCLQLYEPLQFFGEPGGAPNLRRALPAPHPLPDPSSAGPTSAATHLPSSRIRAALVGSGPGPTR